MNSAGDRLRELLKAKKTNAAHLSTKIYCSKNTMSTWLTDRSPIKCHALKRISEVYPDIDMHYIVTGRGCLFLDGRNHEEER